MYGFFVKIIASIIVGGLCALSFWLVKDWRMGFIWLWGFSAALILTSIEVKKDDDIVIWIIDYIFIFILMLIADHRFF